MSRLILLAALVCACDQERDMFPVQPGGGGSGGAMFVDASVTPEDASTQITGRVCLLADARQPTSCASTGADNLIVAAGSEQATTGADGSFTIMRPAGTNLVWSVTGAGIEPSSVRFGGTTTLPALSTALYNDMLAATSETSAVDRGAIIAYVTKAATPVAGAVATATPLPESGTYYDGASITEWNLDAATGAFGVAWIPRIAPGSATIAFDTGAATPTTVSGIRVFAGTITFVFAEIP